MEKITEQDLKQPDVFVHSMDVFWKKLEPFKSAILAGIALIILAGLGYGGWEYYQVSQTKKWGDELFLITHKAEKKKEDLDKQFAEQNKPSKLDSNSKKEAKKDATPVAQQIKNPETLEKEFGAILGDLEKFVVAHNKDRQGLMAALEYSKLAKEYQADAKAQAILEKVSVQPKNEDPLSSIYFLSLGDLLSKQGTCDAAQSLWSKVSFSPLKPEAVLREALCQETKGNEAKAEELYKLLEKDHKDSRAAQQAKKFLRTLKNKARPS